QIDGLTALHKAPAVEHLQDQQLIRTADERSDSRQPGQWTDDIALPRPRQCTDHVCRPLPQRIVERLAVVEHVIQGPAPYAPLSSPRARSLVTVFHIASPRSS